MSISKVFNKTFLKVALLCAMFACVGFLFAGCGGLSKLSDGPDASDIVTGNGSLAVQKGDYLYFVNGYTDTSAIGDTNHYGNIDQSAVYRVKLTADGRVTEAEPEYDDDGEEIFDETKSLQNIDILAPKVAGFEQAKLFIFGDYLYYATPNHLKDGTNTIKSDYLHIYRVRLDRAGGNDLIYATDHETAEVSWTMYQIGDTVYMVVLDGEKLVVININGSSYKTKTVAEDVATASLPVYRNSTDTIRDIDKSIYYTQTVEDDDNTTILSSYNLADQNSAEVFNNKNVKYEIKNTSANRLYYTKTVASQPGFSAKVYSMGTNQVESLVSNLIVGSSDDIQAYALTDGSQGTAILYSDGTNSYFKSATSASAVQFLSSNVISNIVSVQGEYVYYLADSVLYKVNYTLANQTGTALIPSGVTAKGDIANNFSVNGDKVYFFVKYTENYYMHYVDYGIQMSPSDTSAYTHFVGKLLEADYVEAPAE